MTSISNYLNKGKKSKNRRKIQTKGSKIEEQEQRKTQVEVAKREIDVPKRKPRRSISVLSSNGEDDKNEEQVEKVDKTKLLLDTLGFKGGEDYSDDDDDMEESSPKKEEEEHQVGSKRKHDEEEQQQQEQSVVKFGISESSLTKKDQEHSREKSEDDNDDSMSPNKQMVGMVDIMKNFMEEMIKMNRENNRQMQERMDKFIESQSNQQLMITGPNFNGVPSNNKNSSFFSQERRRKRILYTEEQIEKMKKGEFPVQSYNGVTNKDYVTKEIPCDITDLLMLPQKEAAWKLGISESSVSKKFKDAVSKTNNFKDLDQNQKQRKWPYRTATRTINEIKNGLYNNQNLTQEEAEIVLNEIRADPEKLHDKDYINEKGITETHAHVYYEATKFLNSLLAKVCINITVCIPIDNPEQEQVDSKKQTN